MSVQITRGGYNTRFVQIAKESRRTLGVSDVRYPGHHGLPRRAASHTTAYL